MNKSLMIRIIGIVKRFFIWTISQYTCILIFELIAFLVAYMRYGNSRDALHAYSHGGFYTFEAGLLLFIPITTFIYSIWIESRQSGKAHWTLVFPILAVLIITICHIAAGLDRPEIISVDSYMLGCLSSLVFLPVLQLAILFFFKKCKRNK